MRGVPSRCAGLRSAQNISNPCWGVLLLLSMVRGVMRTIKWPQGSFRMWSGFDRVGWPGVSSVSAQTEPASVSTQSSQRRRESGELSWHKIGCGAQAAQREVKESSRRV